MADMDAGATQTLECLLSSRAIWSKPLTVSEILFSHW